MTEEVSAGDGRTRIVFLAIFASLFKMNVAMKRITLLIIITLATGFTCAAQMNRAFRKGYQGSIEIRNGAVFGKDKVGGMLQLTTLQGYRMGNGLFLGAGAGVSYDLVDDIVVFPLFLDAKYIFLDDKVSPFAAARTGFRMEGRDYLAPFVSISAGVDAGRFTIRLGYEYCSVRRMHREYNYTTDIVYLKNISFRKPSQLFCSFAVNF